MITTESVNSLMRRCQIGVGGPNALAQAHDTMAECYGTLGALVAERDAARLECCRMHELAVAIEADPTEPKHRRDYARECLEATNRV